MLVMSTVLLAILTIIGGMIKNGSNHKNQPYPNTAWTPNKYNGGDNNANRQTLEKTLRAFITT